MAKEYESLVISKTFDIQDMVMYPEKISKCRSFDELRRLVSQGHTVEIRDGFSNVVVDNEDMLVTLYSEPEEEKEVVDDTKEEVTEVTTDKIKLPNGQIIDLNELMVQQANGYTHPNYLENKNEGLGLNEGGLPTTPELQFTSPQPTVTETSKPEVTIPETTVLEENTSATSETTEENEEEEVTETEETNTEESTTEEEEGNKQEGNKKKNKGGNK